MIIRLSTKKMENPTSTKKEARFSLMQHRYKFGTAKITKNVRTSQYARSEMKKSILQKLFF